MTAYDASMAGVIVAGMVWGAFRGVTWQLASIASLVLGYSVAHPLSGQLAPYFPGEPVVARSLAMLAVYLGTSCGVFLVAWLIRATLRQFQFEAFDRHLGMLLGGVEGALLGLVVTLFIVSLAPQSREPIFASPTGKVVGSLMSAVGPVLPEEARQVLAPFWSSTAKVAALEDAGETATPAPIPPLRPLSAGQHQRDPATSPASLSDLIQEGENRLGKAIADGASQGIQRAAGGEPNERSSQRR